MMKTILKVILFIVFLLNILFAPTPSIAKEQEWEFVIGAAVVNSDQAWLKAKNIQTAMPILQIDYGRWHFFGNAIVSIDALIYDELSLALGVGYREEGFGASFLTQESTSNSTVFEGYSSPDGDMTAKVNLSWQILSLSYERDISNHSNGTTVTASSTIPIYNFGRVFSVSANLSAEWLSDSYAHHLYGISAKQVDISIGRLAFDSPDLTHYGLGLTAECALTEQWSARVIASYKRLDHNILESPLVGDRNLNLFGAMLIYQF